MSNAEKKNILSDCMQILCILVLGLSQFKYILIGDLYLMESDLAFISKNARFKYHPSFKVFKCARDRDS